MVQFAKNKLNHPVTAFIDIHGHSRKKYYFFYGCNPYLSWNKEDKMFTNSGSHQVIYIRVSGYSHKLHLMY